MCTILAAVFPLVFAGDLEEFTTIRTSTHTELSPRQVVYVDCRKDCHHDILCSQHGNTRQDFAFAPKPAPRPSDMIDKATWDSIVVLPGDVAVRTSNYHGTALMRLHDLWGAWIESFGDEQDSIFPVMLDAGDDFQAATYAALTFDQKNSNDEGGFARRIYSGISEFSHSRPGHSDGDMRESNGPIYVRSVFNHVAWMLFETFGLCFVLLLLSRPKQRLPEPVVELFHDVKRVKSRVTRVAFQFLYPPAEQWHH